MGDRTRGVHELLSEPEAWREIARRVDCLSSHEGYLCDQVGYLEGRYDMYAPFSYSEDLRIPASLGERMLARIREHLGDAAEFSAFPNGDFIAHDSPRLRPYRKARVLAALWLALEAEDEHSASGAP